MNSPGPDPDDEWACGFHDGLNHAAERTGDGGRPARERDALREAVLWLAEELDRAGVHSGPATGAAYRISADRLRAVIAAVDGAA